MCYILGQRRCLRVSAKCLRSSAKWPKTSDKILALTYSFDALQGMPIYPSAGGVGVGRGGLGVDERAQLRWAKVALGDLVYGLGCELA